MNTLKEIYDRLVGMLKSSNENKIIFLKNKLKDIKKGRNEDIQSYFMRITEIKNDLLSIVEAIADRSLPSLPLEDSLANGTCSTLLFLTTTRFQVLKNF